MKNESEVKFNKEVLDPDFLQKQFRLPEAEWDESFRELVRKMIEENQQAIKDYAQTSETGEEELVIEPSQEQWQERFFKSYSESLNIKKEDLMDKRILDLGCGPNGYFVQYLLDQGITNDVLGVDLHLEQKEIGLEFKQNLIEGSFEDNLPIKNADYIFSVGAVSAIDSVKNKIEVIKKWIENLKTGGEIRIYSISEPTENFPWETVKKDWKVWNEIIKEITLAGKAECSMEPKAVRVTGKDNEMMLSYLLVIKKK